MEKLDQAYLNDLIIKTKRGDGNAFAELFAATSEKQYLYLLYLLEDANAAKQALVDVFVHALNNLSGLSNPNLFMIWLSRISRRYVKEHVGNMPALQSEYSKTQLLHLPMAESQIFLMRYEQKMPIPDIAEIMNVGNATIRRFLKLGKKHLKPDEADGEAKDAFAEALAGIKEKSQEKPGTDQHWQAEVHQMMRRRQAKLTSSEMAGILEQVFEKTNREPNTIPMDAISSYTVYRKERFTLQRAILVGAVIVFLLLPVLFILPKYEVRAAEVETRGLPVYSVHIDSALPVGKVTASIKNHSLPVYEAGAKDFTIEPIRNGKMTVYVELFNRQGIEKELEVTDVDAAGPVLKDTVIGDEEFTLFVEDEGIGIDYAEVYAVGKSGEVYEPISADEDNGIRFAYPDESWDIYISDHIGNVLHLSLTLQ